MQLDHGAFLEQRTPFTLVYCIEACCNVKRRERDAFQSTRKTKSFEQAGCTKHACVINNPITVSFMMAGKLRACLDESKDLQHDN